MAQIEIRVDDSEVQSAFSRLIAAGRDPRPALKSIGEYVVRETDSRFQKEQDPEGRPWTPLAASTLKQKAERGKILKILQRDGILRRSIAYQLTENGVAIGSNLVYAAAQQFGFTGQRQARTQTLYFKLSKDGRSVGNRFVKKAKSDFAQDVQVGPGSISIPARPFLGINQQDRREIAQIVLDYLRR